MKKIYESILNDITKLNKQEKIIGASLIAMLIVDIPFAVLTFSTSFIHQAIGWGVMSIVSIIMLMMLLTSIIYEKMVNQQRDN